jgi:HEPN domain-containing protein
MRQHEQALLFMQKAAQDEAAVEELIRSNRVSDEIIGFHCQQAAEKLLKAIYRKAGASGRFDLRYYPGGHKFDAAMQEDAFAFFDRWLKG